ncbi:hypothetical protein OR571_06280 [Psychrobacillus sp. NEAU-3TGS]|uniref:hypothetical protein n=1 Tax=Psychrobacillus sp. NEAU-3TGS TaxID=2995412 RepID=UPI0024995C46|nr:hypothetical protein [Psychrobacillus sp. NEAU-3TGS]MDI2586749.1 hypothetical protein [Psychrobacillus sp. NEAU-3TGS]
MKSNTKLALGVSLFALIGIPLIFLCVSLITENWKFLVFSIFPAFLAGFTSLMATLRQMKKERIYN